MPKLSVEELEKQLAEANEKVTKLEGRKVIYMLATCIPQEASPEVKQTITLHPELGYWDAEHEAEKGRKNRQMLKIVPVKRAE